MTNDRHGSNHPDTLGRLLRELPRERAPEEFTACVMRRIGETGGRPAPRRVAGPLLLAAAAVVVLALAVPVARGLLAPGGDERAATLTAERARRIDALRAEEQRLTSELRELRGLVNGEPRVIYLGGDDSMDLVLDLDRLARGRTGQAPSRGLDVVPASSRGGARRP